MPPTRTPSRGTLRGNDEINRTQAVEEYCDSDQDDYEHADEVGRYEIDEQSNVDSSREEPAAELAQDMNQPRTLLFSGIDQGLVTIGKHGRYYAMGTQNDQSYVDLGYDPNEDSSWFGEVIRPREQDDTTPCHPMHGSSWGLTR